MNSQHTAQRTTWIKALAAIIIIGIFDWLTGYELNLFVFYFLPVSLIAWQCGTGPAAIIAVLCSGVWLLADTLSGHVYSTAVYTFWNTIIRTISFLIIGWSVQKIHALLAAEKQKTEALRRAMSEIKVLRGLLPICAQCKKIRDDQGNWQQLETHIKKHSEADFTHSICPECAKKLYPELYDGKGNLNE